MENYILRYDLVSNSLWNNCNISIKEHILETSSGDNLKFRLEQNELVVDIPFLLLDNIFYVRLNSSVYFVEKIKDIGEHLVVDSNANASLSRHGFLPHAQTQFKNVEIFCSFLSYSFNVETITIKPSFNYTVTSGESSVEELMIVLWQAFQNQLKKVENPNVVLPLSGGMDSRLLLDLCLKSNDLNLQLFTVGTRSSGDVRLAKKIASSIGLADKHIVFFLEELKRKDILDNYESCDYLLPLDRILTKPLGDYYSPSSVVSGLYGDVIFADNVYEKMAYEEFYIRAGFSIRNSIDKEIVNAYNHLPPLPKLQRLLLRGQKLTRQSFPINPGFKYVTPFVDVDVIIAASKISSSGFYPEIIRRYMSKELKKFIHQSSLSHFTHSKYLRLFESKFYRALNHPMKKPYFDDELLRRLDIRRNEAPLVVKKLK